MAINEAKAWIDQRHQAGAKEIGVTFDPSRRKLLVIAGKELHSIECFGLIDSEVRILKDILHDYIAALPGRT